MTGDGGGYRAAFWRYWSAGTVSGVGDAVTAVALPLVAVSVLHASAFQVSLVAAASYIAWLLISLPAGVLVQHLPLRGTQVAMDLVRAAAIVSIPLAAGFGGLTVTQLVVVALVVNVAGVIFFVGNSTFLPAILPKEQLTSRNSLMSATHSTTMLAGPSLGGVLVQFLGAVAALVVDAVSYVVSAVALLGLPRPAQSRPERGASVREQIAQGWRFVVRHPVMRPCLIDATALNFVCGAQLALVPLFLVRTLHASPSMVGVLLATEGLGSLIGATLTPRLVRRFGSGRMTLWGGVFAVLLGMLLPLATSGWGLVVFGIGYAGFSGGVVITSITTRTYRQTATPPELLARVMATVRFVSWGATPLGALVAGLLATRFGVRDALWVVEALAVVSPAVIAFSPIRGMRDLDTAVQPSGPIAQPVSA